MSVLDHVTQYVREHGYAPPGAEVYIDGVEFTGTGDELLDALGWRDAQVRVSIRMPPQADEINVSIVRSLGGT